MSGRFRGATDDGRRQREGATSTASLAKLNFWELKATLVVWRLRREGMFAEQSPEKPQIQAARLLKARTSRSGVPVKCLQMPFTATRGSVTAAVTCRTSLITALEDVRAQTLTLPSDITKGFPMPGLPILATSRMKAVNRGLNWTIFQIINLPEPPEWKYRSRNDLETLKEPAAAF